EQRVRARAPPAGRFLQRRGVAARHQAPPEERLGIAADDGGRSRPGRPGPADHEPRDLPAAGALAPRLRDEALAGVPLAVAVLVDRDAAHEIPAPVADDVAGGS